MYTEQLINELGPNYKSINGQIQYIDTNDGLDITNTNWLTNKSNSISALAQQYQRTFPELSPNEALSRAIESLKQSGSTKTK